MSHVPNLATDAKPELSVTWPALRIFTPGVCDYRMCPACGQDNGDATKSSFSRDLWRIKDCVRCSFTYLENALPYESLVSEQAWTKNFEHESQAERLEAPVGHRLRTGWKELRRRLLRRDKRWTLVRKFVPRGRLLDVGCSYGHLLQAMPTTIEPHGIEIEAEIAAAADAALRPRGGRVVPADALSGLQQYDSGFFDGISMISFLEHELQPAAVLREARRVLRPNGSLVIKVPNYASWNRRLRGTRWCGFRFPDHVNYFTPVTLIEMIRTAHLKIRRCGIVDRLPTSDSLWCVCGL